MYFCQMLREGENMEPLISIIIPVYHVEEYLDYCLQTVTGQTYRNLEILLIDDGSDDGCPQICDAWAEKDNRITVYHKSNNGLSAARNYGIERSHGEYIAFVDSDDYVHPEMIERAFNALQNNHVSMVAFNYCIAKSENEIIHKEYSVQNNILDCEECLIRLLHNDRVITNHVWRYLYSAEIVRKTPFPTGMIHEDMATTYKRIMLAKKVAVLEDELYFYRYNQSSMTNTFSYKNAYDLICSCRLREEDLLSSHPQLKKELQYNRGVNLLKLYLEAHRTPSLNKNSKEFTDLIHQIHTEMKDSRIGKDILLKTKCKYYLIRNFPLLADWYYRK